LLITLELEHDSYAMSMSLTLILRVTLEVLQGGFASGRLMAEGEPQPHETALLQRLPKVSFAYRCHLLGYFYTNCFLGEGRSDPSWAAERVLRQ
jgi:hypothetical protein